MLRLGFTAVDMGRITVTSMAGPFAETVLALGVAAGRSPSPLGADWGGPVRRRVSRRDTELAAVLHPRTHVMLDLITLTGAAETVGEAESALGKVDEQTFARELAAVHPGSVPSWLPGLPMGDRRAVRGLAHAIAHAHRRFVAPYRDAFGALTEAHRRRLARSLGERGARATLASVTGGGWDGPVLSMPEAGLWCDSAIVGRLHGQGMVLAPTVLCRTPVPYFPLDRLLGRTRTALLRAVASGDRSTTEAAAIVRVSAGTASEHLAVLRDGGLLLSIRQRHRMVHTITPLDRRLLDSTTEPRDGEQRSGDR